jgi:hypothetical protein
MHLGDVYPTRDEVPSSPQTKVRVVRNYLAHQSKVGSCLHTSVTSSTRYPQPLRGALNSRCPSFRNTGDGPPEVTKR